MPIKRDEWLEDPLDGIRAYLSQGGNIAEIGKANADAQSQEAQGLQANSRSHLYDPGGSATGFVRMRTNSNMANLAAENSSVASRTGADQTNFNARGMYLHQRVLTAVGTNFGFLPHVQAKMNDGAYITLWSAAAFQTAVGDKAWLFYPGASGVAAAAGLTATVNLPIPRTWRTIMEYSADGTAQTLMDHSYIW